MPNTSRRHSADPELKADGIGPSPEDDLPHSAAAWGASPRSHHEPPTLTLPSQEDQQAKDEAYKYENGGLGH